MRSASRFLRALSPQPTHEVTAGFPLHNPTRLPRRRVLLGALLAFGALHARADIISSCANTSVTEGQDGIVDCTVVNLGANPVNINGVFAFSFPVAGDASDKITSLTVFGPFPNPGNPVVFHIFFKTPNDGAEPNPDFGINDVSFILDAVDAVTGHFVRGTYLSAAVSVYDIGLPPVDPVTGGTATFIDTEDEFFDTAYDAESRGYVNSDVPEPASILLLGSGILGIAALVRKRVARAKGATH